MNGAEWVALAISLKISVVALGLMLVVGLPLAWLLARRSFPGRSIVDAVASLPLVLPPVVTGYALLVWLAPQGFGGRLLDSVFGWKFLFTWPAASLAAAVVSFPLLLRTVRTAIEQVDRGLEEAAANLGASPWQVATRVTLPLARRGIVAGAMLGFGRALGEFGATILVAGNIPGRTQTIPLAIFSMSQSQDLSAALPLVAMISLLALLLVWFADRFAGRST